VLSRHIRLDRAALEPLLAQATADALLLATRPAQAFERLLLPTDADEPVRVAQLRDSLRYLDHDKAYYQRFIDSLPTDDAPLSREVLTQRFAQYQTQNPAPADALPRLVAALSALLPLTEADLRDAPAKPAPAAPAPAPVSPAPTVPPAAAAPVAPSAPAPAAPPTPAPPAAAPVAATPPTAAPTPAGVPLYEKLKATQPATPHLAETLRHSAQGGASPLAERSAPKVASLRDAISINQRFSFINELFSGENMEYHAAIQHLDTLPTADAALAYVRQELAQKYDWSRKEEHVGKLLKLIERKFASA
jgi:hypothetical protein